ncbi:hypothetical protein Y032_0005g2699 [Ancylostoma ceylanicum]|uniref:SCP domain-containing protein n=1 Tax=Ancylostoma ceylanicum TaxID=53326 RepID=A0A016VUX4_9BILA|nr:hypothetical protein Y032_0005g2699 [Ancylostoma ceylanicum]
MWVTILGILLGIAHFPNGVETAEVSAAFNCKNSLIADDWRKLVLNFHNERRRRVSAGEQPYKGGIMPSAKVMNELAWDCNLEDQAQDAAKACTAYNGKYGVNEKMFKANPCNITAETDKVLREWWDEVRNVELENGNKYNDQIKHFGVMAYYPITVVGCSYSQCTGQTNLLCLYQRT